MGNNKAIVVIAINDPYFNYAINQYLSFKFFTKADDIDFVIITNVKHTTQYQNQPGLSIVYIDTFLGEGDILLYKLFVPELVSYQRIIYSDADNLITGDMSIIFNDFEDHSFVVFGDIANGTNWRYDVDYIKANLNLSYLNRINGCLYYYNTSKPDVMNMFAYIKNLIGNYDQLQLPLVYDIFKDDEILFAIGASKYNFTCLPNTGLYKAETMYYAHRRINIIKGKVKLWNTNKNFSFSNIHQPKLVNPLIVAFDRDSRNDFDYIINIKLLKAINKTSFMARLINVYTLYIRLALTYAFTSIKNELHFIKTYKHLN